MVSLKAKLESEAGGLAFMEINVFVLHLGQELTILPGFELMG